MEFTDEEADHISVHEAGHAVCGLLLGGTLGWVALGEVGLDDYPDDNEDTRGSTRCDFPKPWQSCIMSADEEIVARIEFCRQNICQAYAGFIAEEIVFGECPNEGHRGDFDRINFFIKAMLACRLVPYTTENSYAVNIDLRSQTQDMLSTPTAKNAIIILAAALRQQSRIQGKEASKIIQTALVTSEV